MIKKRAETKREVPKQESSGGDLLAQIAQGQAQILQKLKDHDDRFEELEKGQDGEGKAKLLVVDKVFNPDAKSLSDFSVIRNSAIEPFTWATVLGRILDDEVLLGKRSCGDIFMEESKRLFRGRGGKLLELAAEHAKEEAQAQAEGIGAEEARVKGI